MAVALWNTGMGLAERGRSSGLAIVASALLLCWPAIYNGYPLLLGESASYIGTLDPREAHWARPVFYVIFLFPFHLRLSLWPAVFVQALIAAHLVYVVLRATCGHARPELYLGVMAVLAAVSTLPWFTSLIMPDVFTGVAVLGLYLLGVTPDRLGRWERWYIAALTTVAIACQVSHLALAAGLLLVILFLKAATGNHAQWRPAALVLAVAPLVVAAAAHLGVNAFAHRGVTLAPNAPVFLLARMVGDGTAKAYLRAHCPERGYVLCTHLDDLPETADEFLWEDKGLFDRAGGLALREEAREIVAGVLADYPLRQLWHVAANTARQAFVFETGEWLAYADPTVRPVGPVLRDRFPAEYPSYASSRQGTGRIPAIALTVWHALFALIGLAGSTLLFCEFLRRREGGMVALFVVIVAALVGNALIMGGLLDVHGRHQSRIVWLVVLYAAIGARYVYMCSMESERPEA